MRDIDPITGNLVPQKKHEQRWQERTAASVTELPPGLDEASQGIYRFLDQESRGQDGDPPQVPLCRHAPDSYVVDHVLLTSAIAYCLGYDVPELDLHLLRLAALSHEFPTGVRQIIRDRVLLDEGQRQALDRAWETIARQEKVLNRSLQLADFDLAPPDAPFQRIVFYAHLAASGRLRNTVFRDANGQEVGTIEGKADFEQHPLNQVAEQVALVYGGATKIKGYVFESARLPEVRGASSLLDRINMLDVPALWGCRPYDETGWDAGDEHTRYGEVRQQFPDFVLDAPECLVYASGGNFLALAPTQQALDLADAVERLYATETLVAKSVAVSRPFCLIELQYGYRPWVYWLDDYRRDLADDDLRPLLEATYKAPDVSGDEAFLQRKTFGQLVTVLASAANRRRAGNADDGRQPWPLPHYDLLPQAIKCHSCDIRPAVVSIQGPDEVAPAQTPKVFCEACARKRVTGQVAKQDYAATGWFDRKFDWRPTGVPSWEDQFRQYAGSRWEGAMAAADVGEIGSASRPEGYIGFVYADGNNVGALVARITSMSAYRQFGRRLFAASRQAVFAALDEHLEPHCLTASDGTRVITPFEILTIGGDDLSLIVPADRSLDIACSIGHKLEELMQGPRLGAPLTYRERFAPAQGSLPTDREPKVSLSAGVALARDHTPIAYVSELAEQLLKAAKKGAKSRRAKGYSWGTVEFAALKTSGMVSLPWDEFRRSAYATEGRWRLTSRPYTWNEMEGLLQTIRELARANFPRTQIYRLQRDLFQGQPLQAMIDYLYFFGRLSKEAQPILFEHFQKAWHTEQDVPPWRRDQDWQGRDYYETIWRDLVEVYDFAREREEAA